MARFLFFLALLGLTTADLTGFSGRKGALNSDFAAMGGMSLALTASCSSSEIDCGGSCIAGSGECCSASKGSYCESGKYCTADGCCPKGEFCTGKTAGCDAGRQLCGKYCIPSSAVCCSDGSYCNSTETCTSDGFCSKGKGSGSNNNDKPTKTDNNSDNPTETFRSQPTTTSAGQGSGQGNTLCKRKGRSGHSGGDGGGGDGCDNGAESTRASSFASVLVVVFVLMLRRLVCDLGKPKCRKCRIRGVDCPGYQHKPLLWMRPGQTRSKGAQSTKTLGVSAPPATSDEAIANCNFLGQETPTRVQKRKASEGSKVENVASAPIFGVQPATRCALLSNVGDRSTFGKLIQAVVYYNINISPDLSGISLEGAASPFMIPPSYVAQIPPAMAQILISSALGHRILQTTDGFQHERNSMAMNLRQCRGEALRLIRKELTGDRDSIMPILCLLLSEDLIGDSILTCIPCAPSLVAEIIRINHYRFLKDSAMVLPSNHADQLPTGSDILRRLLNFSPELWASEVLAHSACNAGGSFAVRIMGWERIGRIYQSAVVLYCLASQPQGSDHVRESSQWTSLRAGLLRDLRDLSLDAYSHHRKLVLWPLTILGLALDYDDSGTQQFVLQELKWASETLGTATPLVAMQLLERTWRSWQAYSGWDELFDRPYIFAL
ncbi:C6 zinc finger domain-containingprotein [Fusarium austroafricanum]|uniref:C6 zinc finger domain-containingprotein n=1 Tax=Fusarium austroafricanum TaxID=2364996 RepID=A0A8H4JS37_9HYPO|nr:C6 zinc finger domain-containingprotein [Fusarium austroafricanum]